MKTPSLETKDDQKREERVAGFLDGLWGVTCHKLPTNYSLDYWIESKNNCFWCEVKCRSFPATKYETFIVSANKLRKGASFARSSGVPFIIVWAMKDSVWYHQWDPEHEYDIRMNLKEDPKFEEDNEPYVHFPKDICKCLSEKPLGLDREEIGF